MATPIKMPELGESITEGTITRWLKQEGDHVETDEPLFEVSTDKVDTEVPAPVAGVVQKIHVAQDETVAVGAELVDIATGIATGAARAAEQAQPPQPPQPPQPRPEPAAAGAPAAAPAARGRDGGRRG